MTPYVAGHYHRRRLSIVSARSPVSSVRRMSTEEERDPWDAALSLPLSDRGASLLPTPEPRLTKSPVPSINLFSPAGPGPVAPRKLFVPDDTPVQPRWKAVLRQVVHTLFPSIVDLPSRPWLWKIIAVCSAPAIFALTLTLPVVVNDPEADQDNVRPATPLLIEYEESDAEEELIQAQIEAEEHVHDVRFNKWLTAVQCALSPVFCVAVLFCKPDDLARTGRY